MTVQLVQHIPSRQDQFSQELRLASSGDHALAYVAGLYFFHQKITGEPISIYGPQATYWLLGPAPTYPANLLDGYGTDGHTDSRSTSYATFAEVNWRLLPRLRERYPVALHGVLLSVGSADGLDGAYLARLRALADAIEPLFVSDHLSWSRIEGFSAHDLLPLPYAIAHAAVLREAGALPGRDGGVRDLYHCARELTQMSHEVPLTPAQNVKR